LFQADLQDFIRRTIRSAWALEVLLALRRGSHRPWSAGELNQELRSRLGLITEILAGLQNAGLVREEPLGTFRYAPANEELDNLTGQLDEAYATRPFLVLETILSARDTKIQTFADAFKVKKD
jgi:hypothetical protein